MNDIDNRVRLVRIPQNQVLDWFINAVEGWPDNVNLPMYTGLPKGTKVRSVHHDHMSRTFVFLVQHESFSPVPESQLVPPFTEECCIEYRSIPVPEDFDISDDDYSKATALIMGDDVDGA